MIFFEYFSDGIELLNQQRKRNAIVLSCKLARVVLVILPQLLSQKLIVDQICVAEVELNLGPQLIAHAVQITRIIFPLFFILILRRHRNVSVVEE